MNQNMVNLVSTVTVLINESYKEELPTLEQIFCCAEDIRKAYALLYPVQDDEFDRVKKELSDNILHSIGHSHSLKGRDSNHESWYFISENDNYYWNRYRSYLLREKKWGPEVVRRLHETTNDIMDDLGDPNKKDKSFQRRGLLLGDVQSGKTATYTAICNKASDSGYKVIIVLAGMMENLRVQTQSRLDMEFVGVESKYSLDYKADMSVKNTRVGVGKIPPTRFDKRIACFTSVQTDFNRATLRALGLSLKNLNGTALFVVKKNKSVLNNLHRWLLDNNTDAGSDTIDLSLLLIDDEADNASVNTNSDEKDPTAINNGIRNILKSFRQATYLGITATPFANIFIDPSLGEEGIVKDLFPKDFLTVLPTPDHYVGADKLFGNGNADNWKSGDDFRVNAIYNNSIIKILNIEQEDYFKYKHRKELSNILDGLPASLNKAISYFVLANAITDLRLDVKEHRSMLINVSRFTSVQNKIAELVEDFINYLKSDLENYASLPTAQAMKIKSISNLHTIWNEFRLEEKAQCQWPAFLEKYLYKAARRIEVRCVNQDQGASSLNYNDPLFKNIGMRVIAVGGNSLSRGLTLEGLCVSYFYRNTMMYDTLLQMGRWFGYRPNYDDIFQIWMSENSVSWFGYITDATNELKVELKKMERLHQTPEEFGLKVRQAPDSLLITARNKMRTATSMSVPVTVSGRMLETPRLKFSSETIAYNEKLCRSFLKSLNITAGVLRCVYDDFTNAYIWKNVPKALVIELVRNFNTHPWNLNFQPIALADFIEVDQKKLDFWDVAIPNGKLTELNNKKCMIDVFGEIKEIIPEGRSLSLDENIKNLVRVNERHVRVGAGGCSRIGLSSIKIKELREIDKPATDKTYLIPERNPLILIHILKNISEIPIPNEPEFYFALGLGFPKGQDERTAKYMINMNELKNWIEAYDEDEDDDI